LQDAIADFVDRLTKLEKILIEHAELHAAVVEYRKWGY